MSVNFLQAQIYFEDVSLNLGTNSSINISVDLTVKESVVLENNGVLYIKSDDFLSVDFNASEISKSSGLLSFQGKGTVELFRNSGRLTFNNLLLDIDNLVLLNDLDVLNSLEYKSGLVEIENDCELFLKNSDSESLRYDNDQNTYIIGKLRRSTIPNTRYLYPVGNYNSRNNVIIYGIQEISDFVVSYKDASVFSDEVQGDFEHAIDGKWEIKTSSDDNLKPISFYADFYFEDQISLKKDKLYDLCKYIDTENIPEWRQVQNSQKRKKFSTLERTTEGSFSAFSHEKIKWINCLIANGSSSSRLIFPNSEYIMIYELVIRDKQGSVVFNKKNYNNDFDCNGLPEGTYYYDIKYAHKSHIKDIKYKKGFIEVIYEK